MAPISEPAARVDAAALTSLRVSRPNLEVPSAAAAPRPPAKTCRRLNSGFVIVESWHQYLSASTLILTANCG